MRLTDVYKRQAEVLRRNGVRAKIVRKHGDGPGPSGEPTVVTRILAGEVDLIVNTPFGSPGQSGPRLDLSLIHI